MKQRTVIYLTDRVAYIAEFTQKRGSWTRVAVDEITVEPFILPMFESDLAQYTQHLASKIGVLRPDGVSAVLVIPASWCFMHTVESPRRRTDEDVLAFEEFIAAKLEELTCVSTQVDGRHALVAGVYTAAVRALLGTLARASILIDRLTIDSLLLVQSQDSKERSAGCDDVQMGVFDAQRVTFLGCAANGQSKGSMRTLTLPAADGAKLIARQGISTAIASAAASSHWRLLSLSEDSVTDWAADELRAHAATVRVARRDDAVAEVLHAAATSIGGPDLRHGQLQSANGSALLRRRVLKTVAMLTIFLLTYVVNLHHRRDTFVEGVNQLHPLRDAAYAAVFPGRDFTPAAALRVRSEVIKLEALTDAGSSTSESLAVTGLEVFHVLHMVTERIPVAVKVFVREIVMDDRGLRLSGQTTSHGAAGELVQQLNLSGDLVSDPPRTRKRIDGTVDFEVRVRRAKS